MLGLTAIAVSDAGGATVVASDPDAERRAAATLFGAAATSDGSLVGWRSALAEAPGGEHGYVIALELSGAPTAVQQLVSLGDIGAVLVLVGSVFPAGTVAVDPEAVVRGLLTIRGVHNYTAEHLVKAVRFLEQADRNAFTELVGPGHPLHEIDAALEDARSRRTARAAVAPR